MAYESNRCPKCKGEMVHGALITNVRHSMLRVPEWLEGFPEWSFWTGLKTKGRDRHPVRTDRCRECGYLESYAKKA